MLDKLFNFLLATAFILSFVAPIFTQSKTSKVRRSPDYIASVSITEVNALESRIKALESPNLRAFLYLRLANWLVQMKDESLNSRLLPIIETALIDIYEHENEAGRAMTFIQPELLKLARQANPEEAKRLSQKYPLQQKTDESISKFSEASAKLNDPNRVTQGVTELSVLISSGGIHLIKIFGNILAWDAANAPFLPQVLVAFIGLAENSPGAVSLQEVQLLNLVCLKPTMPAELQTRYLAVVVNATRDTPNLLQDQAKFDIAVSLLQRTLPIMEKLAPALYTQGAGQLAALQASRSLSNNPREEAFRRIRESADPLAQTITEAENAKDVETKSALFHSAAELAKKQGRLRQAVQLMLEAKRTYTGKTYDYEYYADELIGKVVQDAVAQPDLETAHYAALEIVNLFKRANSLRLIAQYFTKKKDLLKATESLQEASKYLANSSAGKEKAIGYCQLTLDWAEVDDFQFRESVRLLIKAANNVEKPGKDPKGEFSWSLLPLLSAESKVFTKFAEKDRTGALNTAESFTYAEMRAAAVLGVYQYQPTQKTPGKE